MRKVMVFGVFDGVHEGHRHFFREAKKIAERIAEIEQEIEVDEVLVGDEEMGSWEIIKRIRPHVVAVGYDQKEMKRDLENSIDNFNWFIEIETISAHKPEKYHSSLLDS